MRSRCSGPLSPALPRRLRSGGESRSHRDCHWRQDDCPGVAGDGLGPGAQMLAMGGFGHSRFRDFCSRRRNHGCVRRPRRRCYSRTRTRCSSAGRSGHALAPVRARRCTLGDQEGRAADGHGIEHVVARRTEERGSHGKPWRASNSWRSPKPSAWRFLLITGLPAFMRAKASSGWASWTIECNASLPRISSSTSRIFREEMERLLCQPDAQCLAERGRGMRRAAERRPAGRKTELVLPGRSARASRSQARPGRGSSTRPIGISTARTERPSQVSASVFNDGNVQRTIAGTPADHPAGAATVGAGDDQAPYQLAIWVLRLPSTARNSSVVR